MYSGLGTTWKYLFQSMVQLKILYVEYAACKHSKRKTSSRQQQAKSIVLPALKTVAIKQIYFKNCYHQHNTQSCCFRIGDLADCVVAHGVPRLIALNTEYHF
jgi:hypothetical protein